MAAVALVAQPVPAEAKEWRIEAMDVTLDVQTSGDVLVSEDVTFAFVGSFSYVARVIPKDTLEGITDVQVLQDGRPLPDGTEPGSYDVFTEGDDLVVQLAFALTDTSETWTIRYLAKAAVAYYDEADELVWHVFDARDARAHRPGARHRTPARGRCPPTTSTGRSTPASTCRARSRARRPRPWSSRRGEFPAYTKYWIAAGFPKGVVAYTWTFRRLAAAVTPRPGSCSPSPRFLGMLAGLVQTWQGRARRRLREVRRRTTLDSTARRRRSPPRRAGRQPRALRHPGRSCPTGLPRASPDPDGPDHLADPETEVHQGSGRARPVRGRHPLCSRRRAGEVASPPDPHGRTGRRLRREGVQGPARPQLFRSHAFRRPAALEGSRLLSGVRAAGAARSCWASRVSAAGATSPWARW